MLNLGDLERRVMDALWSAPAPRTAAELQDILAQGPGARALAHTTVLTVLSRLEDKNFVVRDRSLRPHLYRAARDRAEVTAELMHDVLGTSHDREAVLSRFLGDVSSDDTEVLRRLLNAS